MNKDSSKSSRKYQCQNGKMEKNILKDCFLQGTNLSPVLPEENDDDMFYCNNSMIIKDQNVCMNSFKNQLLQELLKNVSCESGNQTE